MVLINRFLRFALANRKSVIGVAAVIIFIGAFYQACRPSDRSPLPPKSPTTEVTQQKMSAGSIPRPQPPKSGTTNAPKRSVILAIDAHLPSPSNAVTGAFAPAGSVLVCQLINTVESIHIDTPIIGVVTRDLWFGKKLIVPSGSRVFGTAKADRVRDRISASGSWTLVFPSGEELMVVAMALHREEIVPGQRWGLDDGSAGLKGQVIKNATFDEIKLFAAAFLSGVSQGFQETESTVFGSRTRRSIQNAALTGSSAVLDDYARSIAESIKRDGVYVRVPGGTEFYLYLPTTLDRSAARIGATIQKTPKP